MTQNESGIPTAAHDPVAAIASCALDEDARGEQIRRYRQLASAVTSLEREPERITVQFAERVDRDLLESTLAIERRCCPFFTFVFDDRAARLEIGVQEPDERPALEAMAYALTPVGSASTDERPREQ